MEHGAYFLIQALVISRLDYCNALLARVYRSLKMRDALWYHYREAQNHFPEFFFHSSWWNDLPTPIQNAESQTILRNHQKLNVSAS